MPRAHLALVVLASAFALSTAPRIALAGEADVLEVVPHCNEEVTVCRFTVTIRHDDAGWEHYADQWEVMTPDGKRLGTRVLRHPHVDEQPFTRSMQAMRIPRSVDRITIRARDNVHGFGGETVTIDLPKPKAPAEPAESEKKADAAP